MKRWLITIFASVLTSTANAVIVIPGAQISDTEYRAYLRVHPDDNSPTSRILQSHPTKPHQDQLLAALAGAQDAYLNQNSDLAIMRFKELVALRQDDDWSAENRSVFLYAYLRLYQLEPTVISWLEQAASLGTDIHPENDIFPAGMIIQLQSFREKIKYLAIDSRSFEDWPTLIFNGQICSKDFCHKIPDAGKNRITWISDRWQTHVAFLTASEFANYKPPKEPWVRGKCGQGQLTPLAKELGEAKEFWGLDCEITKPWLPQTSMPNSSQSVSLIKSKWLWAGLGVIAGGLILKYQADHQTKEPTTTYGY